MKKRRVMTNRIVVITFLVLYLVIMFVTTFLVKENYVTEYKNYMVEKKEEYISLLENENLYLGGYEEERIDNISSYARRLLAKLEGKDQFQQISGAFYDNSGTLQAVTEDLFGTIRFKFEQSSENHEWNNYNGLVGEYFSIDDYLTEEEKTKLMSYEATLEQDLTYEEAAKLYETNEKEVVYKSHRMELKLDSSFQLSGITIREYEIKVIYKAGEQRVDKGIVWEWKNENNQESGYQYTAELLLPYYKNGEEARQRWQQDEWLLNYPEQVHDRGELLDIDKVHDGEQTSGFVDFQKEIDQYRQKTYTYILVLRQTSHPWLAAMDDMKYIYPATLFLVLICMAIVLYAAKKTDEKQQKLEMQRRDFVNAAAHEMKTPLSIIRGFTENVKENTIEEKRDYYLDQIISQTEELDELVKEMIQVSKLDSEQLNLINEILSIEQILKLQMKKLEPFIQEKSLKIIYETEEDFSFEGDRVQIEKMIWNLLSNAVEHNRKNGSIWVFIGKDRVTIENSGNKIPEEKFPYIFDMFYTGDESRHERSKHMGLGLYLAKKICDVHGLKLEVCNTDVGVKADVYK